MQIVIDIDDKLYKRIKYLEPKADTMLDELMRSVQNGTPLPKGHGRLIDGDELESRMKIGYCIVKNAPTIIDAEREDKE